MSDIYTDYLNQFRNNVSLSLLDENNQEITKVSQDITDAIKNILENLTNKLDEDNITGTSLSTRLQNKITQLEAAINTALDQYCEDAKASRTYLLDDDRNTLDNAFKEEADFFTDYVIPTIANVNAQKDIVSNLNYYQLTYLLQGMDEELSQLYDNSSFKQMQQIISKAETDLSEVVKEASDQVSEDLSKLSSDIQSIDYDSIIDNYDSISKGIKTYNKLQLTKTFTKSDVLLANPIEYDEDNTSLIIHLNGVNNINYNADKTQVYINLNTAAINTTDFYNGGKGYYNIVKTISNDNGIYRKTTDVSEVLIPDAINADEIKNSYVKVHIAKWQTIDSDDDTTITISIPYCTQNDYTDERKAELAAQGYEYVWGSLMTTSVTESLDNISSMSPSANYIQSKVYDGNQLQLGDALELSGEVNKKIYWDLGSWDLSTFSDIEGSPISGNSDIRYYSTEDTAEIITWIANNSKTGGATENVTTLDSIEKVDLKSLARSCIDDLSSFIDVGAYDYNYCIYLPQVKLTGTNDSFYIALAKEDLIKQYLTAENSNDDNTLYHVVEDNVAANSEESHPAFIIKVDSINNKNFHGCFPISVINNNATSTTDGSQYLLLTSEYQGKLKLTDEEDDLILPEATVIAPIKQPHTYNPYTDSLTDLSGVEEFNQSKFITAYKRIKPYSFGETYQVNLFEKICDNFDKEAYNSLSYDDKNDVNKYCYYPVKESFTYKEVTYTDYIDIATANNILEQFIVNETFTEDDGNSIFEEGMELSRDEYYINISTSNRSKCTRQTTYDDFIDTTEDNIKYGYIYYPKGSECKTYPAGEYITESMYNSISSSFQNYYQLVYVANEELSYYTTEYDINDTLSYEEYNNWKPTYAETYSDQILLDYCTKLKTENAIKETYKNNKLYSKTSAAKFIIIDDANLLSTDTEKFITDYDGNNENELYRVTSRNAVNALKWFEQAKDTDYLPDAVITLLKNAYFELDTQQIKILSYFSLNPSSAYCGKGYLDIQPAQLRVDFSSNTIQYYPLAELTPTYTPTASFSCANTVISNENFSGNIDESKLSKIMILYPKGAVISEYEYNLLSEENKTRCITRYVYPHGMPSDSYENYMDEDYFDELSETDQNSYEYKLYVANEDLYTEITTPTSKDTLVWTESNIAFYRWLLDLYYSSTTYPKNYLINQSIYENLTEASKNNIILLNYSPFQPALGVYALSLTAGEKLSNPYCYNYTLFGNYYNKTQLAANARTRGFLYTCQECDADKISITYTLLEEIDVNALNIDTQKTKNFNYAVGTSLTQAQVDELDNYVTNDELQNFIFDLSMVSMTITALEDVKLIYNTNIIIPIYNYVQSLKVSSVSNNIPYISQFYYYVNAQIDENDNLKITDSTYNWAWNVYNEDLQIAKNYDNLGLKIVTKTISKNDSEWSNWKYYKNTAMGPLYKKMNSVLSFSYPESDGGSVYVYRFSAHPINRFIVDKTYSDFYKDTSTSFWHSSGRMIYYDVETSEIVFMVETVVLDDSYTFTYLDLDDDVWLKPTITVTPAQMNLQLSPSKYTITYGHIPQANEFTLKWKQTNPSSETNQYDDFTDTGLNTNAIRLLDSKKKAIAPIVSESFSKNFDISNLNLLPPVGQYNDVITTSAVNKILEKRGNATNYADYSFCYNDFEYTNPLVNIIPAEVYIGLDSNVAPELEDGKLTNLDKILTISSPSSTDKNSIFYNANFNVQGLEASTSSVNTLANTGYINHLGLKITSDFTLTIQPWSEEDNYTASSDFSYTMITKDSLQNESVYNTLTDTEKEKCTYKYYSAYLDYEDGTENTERVIEFMPISFSAHKYDLLDSNSLPKLYSKVTWYAIKQGYTINNTTVHLYEDIDIENGNYAVTILKSSDYSKLTDTEKTLVTPYEYEYDIHVPVAIYNTYFKGKTEASYFTVSQYKNTKTNQIINTTAYNSLGSKTKLNYSPYLYTVNYTKVYANQLTYARTSVFSESQTDEDYQTYMLMLKDYMNNYMLDIITDNMHKVVTAFTVNNTTYAKNSWITDYAYDNLSDDNKANCETDTTERIVTFTDFDASLQGNIYDPLGYSKMYIAQEDIVRKVEKGDTILTTFYNSTITDQKLTANCSPIYTKPKFIFNDTSNFDIIIQDAAMTYTPITTGDET